MILPAQTLLQGYKFYPPCEMNDYWEHKETVACRVTQTRQKCSGKKLVANGANASEEFETWFCFHRYFIDGKKSTAKCCFIKSPQLYRYNAKPNFPFDVGEFSISTIHVCQDIFCFPWNWSIEFEHWCQGIAPLLLLLLSIVSVIVCEARFFFFVKSWLINCAQRFPIHCIHLAIVIVPSHLGGL